MNLSELNKNCVIRLKCLMSFIKRKIVWDNSNSSCETIFGQIILTLFFFEYRRIIKKKIN